MFEVNNKTVTILIGLNYTFLDTYFVPHNFSQIISFLQNFLPLQAPSLTLSQSSFQLPAIANDSGRGEKDERE